MKYLLGRVLPEESLFSGPAMERRKRQTDEEFVPVFLDDLIFTEDQIVSCVGNLQCLFDLAATGSVEFANTTLMDDRAANETKDMLGNWILCTLLCVHSCKFHS